MTFDVADEASLEQQWRTIRALAVALSAKDEITHEHVLRVQTYVEGVGRLLGCSATEIEALKAGALLHDIGKLAVPDCILNKPGKLSPEEFNVMKRHTLYGARIVESAGLLLPVTPIVRHHHERWDGAGYPDGLCGEDIPLTARILSVVDCFDAVREDRPYRLGFTRHEAAEYLRRESGRMYDPTVVEVFLRHLPEFEAQIKAKFDRRAGSDAAEVEGAGEELSDAARAALPAAGVAFEDAPAREEGISLTRAELRGICELSQALRSGPRDARRLSAVFAERLADVVPYDSCAVTLFAPETGRVRVVAARGENQALQRGREIQLKEGVTGWVLSNRRPFCNANPLLDFEPAIARAFQSYRTLAVFPLLDGEHVHGAVSVYARSFERYTEAQQALLREVSGLLAAALTEDAEAARRAVGRETLAYRMVNFQGIEEVGRRGGSSSSARPLN